MTSGATETDNLAHQGRRRVLQGQGNHIITGADRAQGRPRHLQAPREGGLRGHLPAGRRPTGMRHSGAGRARRSTDKTILVAMMLANNEIGTVQPGRRDRRGRQAKKGVLFHIDAVQGVGKVPFDVKAAQASTWCRSRRTRCTGRRASARSTCAASRACASPRRSTAAVTSAACARARSTCRASSASARRPSSRAPRWPTEAQAARSRCASGCARICRRARPTCYVNGSLEHRLPGNLNICFAFVEGEALMMAIKDVAVSSGSACTSASLEPSYVLRALGVGDELAHSSIRFGLGRFNTEEEVDYVIDLVVEARSSGCARCRRSTRCARRASTSSPSSGQRTERS